jgi:hypothetical protein
MCICIAFVHSYTHCRDACMTCTTAIQQLQFALLRGAGALHMTITRPRALCCDLRCGVCHADSILSLRVTCLKCSGASAERDWLRPYYSATVCWKHVFDFLLTPPWLGLQCNSNGSMLAASVCAYTSHLCICTHCMTCTTGNEQLQFALLTGHHGGGALHVSVTNLPPHAAAVVYGAVSDMLLD